VAKKCHQCGERLERIATVDLSGQEGGMSVRLVGFPYRTCPQDHERTFVYPDFGSDLYNLLFGGEIPVTAKAGGLFSRRDVCVSCWAGLDSGGLEQESTFRREPRLGEAPPFELYLTSPAVVCPACGTAQIRRSDYGQPGLNPLDALLAAFKTAAIEP
jgi:hypothetical protein